MSNDVLTRWQGFVKKVTARLQEVLAESNAGFEGLLTDPGLDPIAFTNAMKAIEVRCKDLRATLETTYSQNVVLPLLGQVGDAEVLLRDSGDWMDTTFERFRVGWNDKLVRHLWSRVEPMLKAPVGCTKCGAGLTRTMFHQAESVTCTHCRAVNSVTPDPLVYTYFSMAPHLYAEGQTLEPKLALDRAEKRGVRGGELEAMTRGYWTAYARAYAQIGPMDAAEQARFVEGKITALRRFG